MAGLGWQLHLVGAREWTWPQCGLAVSVCPALARSLQVLSINEEGLRRCEENTKVFGRPIR